MDCHLNSKPCPGSFGIGALAVGKKIGIYLVCQAIFRQARRRILLFVYVRLLDVLRNTCSHEPFAEKARGSYRTWPVILVHLHALPLADEESVCHNPGNKHHAHGRKR